MDPKMSRPADPAAVLKRVIRYMLHYYKAPFALVVLCIIINAGASVLAATFPAGTVSGAPKVRAMEIIRSLEGRARGPYAGCIGWLGLDKDSVDLDMGIAIRSMWSREGRLFWQAGGGIVHDSDAALEWKEVCNKSAIMRLVLEEGDDHVPAHR